MDFLVKKLGLLDYADFSLFLQYFGTPKMGYKLNSEPQLGMPTGLLYLMEDAYLVSF